MADVPPTALVSLREASDIFGVVFANTHAFEKRTGLLPKATFHGSKCYDRAECVIQAEKNKQEAVNKNAARAEHMKRLNEFRWGTKEVSPDTSPLTEAINKNTAEMEALRQETSAAFNLIMEQLSLIKCQLVELAPTMPLPPTPPSLPPKKV